MNLDRDVSSTYFKIFSVKYVDFRNKRQINYVKFFRDIHNT